MTKYSFRTKTYHSGARRVKRPGAPAKAKFDAKARRAAKETGNGGAIIAFAGIQKAANSLAIRNQARIADMGSFASRDAG